MAKDRPPESPSNPDDGAASEPRLRKLERRLDAARTLEAKRARQLAKAHRRTEKLQATIVAIAAPSHAAPGAAANDASVPDGPIGFCMRERATVSIDNPVAFVMHNGRSALAGTCHNCGVRVVTIATSPGSGAAV